MAFWQTSNPCTSPACHKREALLMDQLRIARQQLIESLAAQGELFNIVAELSHKDPS